MTTSETPQAPPPGSLGSVLRLELAGSVTYPQNDPQSVDAPVDEQEQDGEE